MIGPCSYHNHVKYKATHSTRDCTLNDKLAMEKAVKPNANIDGDDDENPPPPAGGAGKAGRDAGGAGGASKGCPQQIQRVNIIFRGHKSKHTQKQAISEVYSLVPGVSQYLDWSDSMISFDQSDQADQP